MPGIITDHRPFQPTRAAERPRVRLPDTATSAVLVDELLGTDGPYADYADHWLRVGGMHCLVPFPAFNSAA